jgi:hypothetical protein
MEVVDLVRNASAQMAGLKKRLRCLCRKPEAASDSPFAINWMGAPVGRTYDVERAISAKGPWTVVGQISLTG